MTVLVRIWPSRRVSRRISAHGLDLPGTLGTLGIDRPVVLELRVETAGNVDRRDLPPWWIRAPVLGAWMNFVLTFFAYDVMKAMMTSLFGADGILTSPFWFAAEEVIWVARGSYKFGVMQDRRPVGAGGWQP